MLRKEGDHVYAVLNDFDLAVSADAQSQSLKHRTGTMPFMAIDLLREEPVEHLYRHDLESLFYVLVWITSRFNDGKEIPSPPLQEWAKGDHRIVETSKCAFILEPSLFPTEKFESFGFHITRMHMMFRQGHAARSNARAFARRFNIGSPVTSFDDVTLGGWVTFDTFQSILDTDLLICTTSAPA